MSSPQITRMFGRSASDMQLLRSARSVHSSGRGPRIHHLVRTIRGPPRAPIMALMSRERWMALCFALGSACFLIGPFPGYAELVGARADAVTFFVGSLLFTTGAALQVWLAAPRRRSGRAASAAWRAAGVQLVGTLFFNVSTFRALWTVLAASAYDR